MFKWKLHESMFFLPQNKYMEMYDVIIIVNVKKMTSGFFINIFFILISFPLRSFYAFYYLTLRCHTWR
ncbi:hypothetical protein SME41J_48000 (plasmid) [Serratia marcescens]|nr:hypothetical protein SME41J_48000 [Serratia marcescens]